ncbi:MAG: hypothetical protein PHW27_01935 [Melioribacteraceae bacterium]|nr:hypothetical protein [Melioribacteraceae bacterium]
MIVYEVTNVIFTKEYLPKLDNYYKPSYIVENNYNQSKDQNSIENNHVGFSYFPSLDYSITKSENKSTSGSDIADVITNDKSKFLYATAEHLKSQIEQRSKIRDDHIADLDSKIMECDTALMNMESWPIFSNPMVEKRRADFQNTIQRLELEKRQEVTKCWKDNSPLYKELLETLGEHKNVQRRSKMLSGGF